MATSIFELFGTINVDTSAFTTAITNAITQVQNLQSQLNALNGQSLSINNTGNTGSAAASASSASSAQVVPLTGTGGSTTGSTSTASGSGSSSGTSQGSSAGGTASTSSVLGSIKNTLASSQTKAMFGMLATRTMDFVYSEFTEFWNEGIDYYETRETGIASISSIMKMDEMESAAFSDKLEEFAVRTPYSYSDTLAATRILAGYGLTGDGVDETLKRLEVLGNLTGGNLTKLPALAMAIGQTKGFEKLLAQEGKQFINAGVPIYEIIADYYNREGRIYTTSEGEQVPYDSGIVASQLNGSSAFGIIVPFEDIWNAFEYETTQPGGRYYRVMDKMVATHAGREEQFAEASSQAAAEMTTSTAEYETDVILPLMTEDAMKRKGIFKEYSDEIRAYGKFFNDVKLAAHVALTDTIAALGEMERENAGSTAGIASLGFGALSQYLGSSTSSGFGGMMAKYGSLTSGLFSIMAAVTNIGVSAEERAADFENAMYGNFSAAGLFMSPETLATLQANGGDISELGFQGKAEYYIGKALQLSADAFGQSDYGTMAYLAHPFADLYEDVTSLPETIKQNASTFAEDWSNLFSSIRGSKLSFDDRGGGRRFDVAEDTVNETTQYTPQFESIIRDLEYFVYTQGLSRHPSDYFSNDRIEHMMELLTPDGTNSSGFENNTGLPLEGVSSFLTEMHNMPSMITAAVQDGFTGATVTVNVSTGDVRLDTGALAGSLAPRVDAILGALNARASRG